MLGRKGGGWWKRSQTVAHRGASGRADGLAIADGGVIDGGEALLAGTEVGTVEAELALVRGDWRDSTAEREGRWEM